MHWRLRALLVLGCTFIASVGQHAHADSADVVFHGMYDFFDAAEDRSGLDQQLVSSLRSQVRLMKDVTARFKGAAQPDYLKALSSDAALLKLALAQPDNSISNETIKFVRDDLALKVRFEASIAGAQDSFRGKVQVSVSTKRNGADVSGLIVGANPRLWQDNSQLMFPIGPSSPAHGSLPPGIYRMVVTRAGGQLVVTQDCSIGLAGRDSEDITVVVPDGP
jgi:hypothetical protein